MATTRDQIINTACTLLEAQGYHATGLNQIVAESGSPKGSLYHYFPAGKEELAAEAIGRTACEIEARLRAGLASVEEPGEAVERFFGVIADHVAQSGYRAGGPLTMVAMETAATSQRLSEACSAAFGLWQGVFVEKLEASGFAPARAATLSTLIVAALEGSVLLSRTHHDATALRQVGAELRWMVDHAPREA